MRLRTVGPSVALVLVVTGAVIAAAGRLPGTVLSRAVQVAGPDYGALGLRPLPALADRFVEQELGSLVALAFLGAGTGPVPPATSSAGSQPGGQGEETENDAGPEDLAAPSDLTIGMTASRTSAGPGDTIRYVITVVNVGKGVAKGVTVRSHIPARTRFVETCEGGYVSVVDNPGATGGRTVVVCVPCESRGTSGHDIQNSMGALRPGQRVQTIFTVRIDEDAPDGLMIRNHAHVTSENEVSQTSNEVTTRVRRG